MQERDELLKRFKEGYAKYGDGVLLRACKLLDNGSCWTNDTDKKLSQGGNRAFVGINGLVGDYGYVPIYDAGDEGGDCWLELAGEAGAWLKDTKRMGGSTDPRCLWSHFVHCTLLGYEAEKVDNVYQYNAFPASMSALHKDMENEAHRDDEESEPKTNAVHLTDFRSVKWFGKEYSFSANQARVIRLLWENWKNGTAEVGQETLLNEIDHASPPDRLNNVFRDQPAWGEMIVSGTTKGTFRLIELSSDLDLD